MAANKNKVLLAIISLFKKIYSYNNQSFLGKLIQKKGNPIKWCS